MQGGRSRLIPFLPLGSGLGFRNVLELIEFFEEDDRFYLVFEKMRGGKYTWKWVSGVCVYTKEREA